ncbi:hypothetical protein DQ04_18951000 [Trypanosoma grayi]|uniref:hypothetical protein n=1 Tax=Trypanosoma grayi TaxID=71804 RepID=UPI0004F49CA4|nr:hypothetical protein DQ04_18951000 [Trypanosoma grayi]KEG05724.1 hypothetical protein DQ04_18951000 [Trypanosoma grayi]
MLNVGGGHFPHELRQLISAALDVAVKAASAAEELLCQTEAEANTAKIMEAEVKEKESGDEDEMYVSARLAADKASTAVTVSLKVREKMEEAMNAATEAENARKEIEEIMKLASTGTATGGAHTSGSNAHPPAAPSAKMTMGNPSVPQPEEMRPATTTTRTTTSGSSSSTLHTSQNSKATVTGPSTTGSTVHGHGVFNPAQEPPAAGTRKTAVVGNPQEPTEVQFGAYAAPHSENDEGSAASESRNTTSVAGTPPMNMSGYSHDNGVLADGSNNVWRARLLLLCMVVMTSLCSAVVL